MHYKQVTEGLVPLLRCLSPHSYCWSRLCPATVTHLEFPTHSPLKSQELARGPPQSAEVASPKLDGAGEKSLLPGSLPYSPHTCSSLPPRLLIFTVTGVIVIFHLQD